MNKTHLFLDAVMQLNTEIKEIVLIAGFLSVALIINIPALQPILMMGATYLVSLTIVALIFLILVLKQDPQTAH